MTSEKDMLTRPKRAQIGNLASIPGRKTRLGRISSQEGRRGLGPPHSTGGDWLAHKFEIQISASIFNLLPLSSSSPRFLPLASYSDFPILTHDLSLYYTKYFCLSNILHLFTYALRLFLIIVVFY